MTSLSKMPPLWNSCTTNY